MGRLAYVLPAARELALSTARRLRPGGLASTLRSTPGAEPLVIVTGAGRSGTSAVARVLHESGVSMGERFREPSEFNAVGFYEELRVTDLNDDILAGAGMTDASRRAPRSLLLAAAARHARAIEEVAATCRVDGWKDPRFAWTLEGWLPHLPRPPKVVVCLRSPEAFVQSVTRAFGLIDRRVLERAWAGALRRTLDVVRDYRLEATCVEYESLVRAPQETVAALASFVGRPLDASFVRPELRQYAQAVPRRHAALYDDVRALGPRPAAAGPPADGAQDVDEYLERVRDIEGTVLTAKASWDETAGAPPRLDALEGPETRATCASYIETLAAAQTALGALVPPDGFDAYHDATRELVDNERLAARLLLRVGEEGWPQERARAEAERGWRAYASPDVTAKTQRRRRRALERAVRASGERAETSA